MTSTGLITRKKQSRGSISYEPHEYQKRAIELMVKQACAGLFLDPGLGKTSISLAAFSVLGEEGFVKGMLVIAPLRAIYNVWPAEVKKWRDFNGLSVGILHGPDKNEVFEEDHDVYVINPEGVAWLTPKLMRLRPDDWPFDMLVVDESTKFKSASSQRFKLLRKVLHNFKRRYILTGTPTPNGLLDLFGQIFILDLGNSLGQYITHYRNSYFFSSGYGGYTWTPMLHAMRDISEAISPLVLRMAAEDYLELPELTQTMIWLDLPKAARKIYKGLEDDFITEVGENTITAPSAAAAGIKCRQVLNGAIYHEEESEKRKWSHVHDVKMDALVDLVEELSGQPLLVLYEFKHDRERILKKFPDCAVLGGQSMKKDQIVIDRFNRGEIPMVVGHPASMGHALNLQGDCAHICWFGLTWNFEHYDQAIKRIWRQGNEAPRVIVYHLCIRDSLDVAVVKALYWKDNVQEKFVDAIQILRGDH
jgi:SNF2 family DNA or RNA helicase